MWRHSGPTAPCLAGLAMTGAPAFTQAKLTQRGKSIPSQRCRRPTIKRLWQNSRWHWKRARLPSKLTAKWLITLCMFRLKAVLDRFGVQKSDIFTQNMGDSLIRPWQKKRRTGKGGRPRYSAKERSRAANHARPVIPFLRHPQSNRQCPGKYLQRLRPWDGSTSSYIHNSFGPLSRSNQA